MKSRIKRFICIVSAAMILTGVLSGFASAPKVAAAPSTVSLTRGIGGDPLPPTPIPPRPTPTPEPQTLDIKGLCIDKATITTNAIGYETVIYKDKASYSYYVGGKVEGLKGSWLITMKVYSHDLGREVKSYSDSGNYSKYKTYDLSKFKASMKTLSCGTYTLTVKATSQSKTVQKTLFFHVMKESAKNLIYDLYFYFRPGTNIPMATVFKEALKLSKQQESAKAMVRRILLSADFLPRIKNLSAEKFITNLYLTILGRTPDREGLEFWIGYFQFHSIEEVIDGFLNSQEFQNRCSKKGWVY